MSKKKNVNVVEEVETEKVEEIEVEQKGILSKFRKPKTEGDEVTTEEKKRLPKWAKRTLIVGGALVSGGVGYLLGTRSHSYDDSDVINNDDSDYSNTESNDDVTTIEF